MNSIEQTLLKVHFHLAGAAAIVGGQTVTRKMSKAMLGIAIDHARKAVDEMLGLGGDNTAQATDAPEYREAQEPADV